MANIIDMSTASTNIAAEFIDQQASTIHPAFGGESFFNQSTSRYQSKEVWNLQETLKRLQSTTSHQINLDFDILRCTWDDVLHEQERAQTAVFESENSGKQFHQKVYRPMGAMGSEYMCTGPATIPDELCVLHGGLAVMFCLARQRTQNRQKILRAFEDIPNVMMMASGKIETDPRDHEGCEKLDRTIKELQNILLRALPILIDRLRPETLVEKIMSTSKEVSIDELLAAVRSSSDKVRGCAEGMKDSILFDTHQTAHDNYHATQDIHNITRQTGGEVENLHGKIEQLLEHQRKMELTLNSMSGKNNLFDFLTEYLKTEQTEDRKTPPQSPTAYEQATPITPRQLLRLMNVHHLGAVNTELHIISRGHSMDNDAISHAASMFQTSQVQQLLQSSDSGIVLVNGHADRSQLSRISPLSYICAVLAQALRSSPNRNVVLAYFCGQHSASTDDLRGPQGLMRSLVASLVLSLVKDSFISENVPVWFSDFSGNLEELSFYNICQLFYRIIEQLPQGITSYCIIDGISYYEKPVWKADYDMVMDCFGNIITNKKFGVCFKLLLTSPTKSIWLSSSLTSDQRVSLRNSGRKGKVRLETYLQTGFDEKMLHRDE